ncbi:UNVERIFIED_CONTAM: hypothetical protein Sindi_1662400 [Sesamum indicum]
MEEVVETQKCYHTNTRVQNCQWRAFQAMAGSMAPLSPYAYWIVVANYVGCSCSRRMELACFSFCRNSADLEGAFATSAWQRLGKVEPSPQIALCTYCRLHLRRLF